MITMLIAVSIHTAVFGQTSGSGHKIHRGSPQPGTSHHAQSYGARAEANSSKRSVGHPVHVHVHRVGAGGLERASAGVLGKNHQVTKYYSTNTNGDVTLTVSTFPAVIRIQKLGYRKKPTDWPVSESDKSISVDLYYTGSDDTDSTQMLAAILHNSRLNSELAASDKGYRNTWNQVLWADPADKKTIADSLAALDDRYASVVPAVEAYKQVKPANIRAAKAQFALKGATGSVPMPLDLKKLDIPPLVVADLAVSSYGIGTPDKDKRALLLKKFHDSWDSQQIHKQIRASCAKLKIGDETDIPIVTSAKKTYTASTKSSQITPNIK